MDIKGCHTILKDWVQSDIVLLCFLLIIDRRLFVVLKSLMDDLLFRFVDVPLKRRAMLAAKPSRSIRRHLTELALVKDANATHYLLDKVSRRLVLFLF